MNLNQREIYLIKVLSSYSIEKLCLEENGSSLMSFGNVVVDRDAGGVKAKWKWSSDGRPALETPHRYTFTSQPTLLGLRLVRTIAFQCCLYFPTT